MDQEPTLSQRIDWLESDLDEAKRRMHRLDGLWGITFVAIVLAFPLFERMQAVVGSIFLAALGIIQVTTSHMRFFHLDLKLVMLKEALRREECQRNSKS